MVCKFDIYSQEVPSVCCRLPQVAVLSACSNMTLAIEWDVKHHLALKTNNFFLLLGSSCSFSGQWSSIFYNFQ